MIGLRIKHFRELKGFKREWLANELGISNSQLNRVENGVNTINIDRLYQIGELLRVNIFDSKNQ